MFTVTIPETTLFNEDRNEFLEPIPETTLKLEHSLASVRKWESKWHIPFIATSEKDDNKTDEQMVDYVRCMCLNEVEDPRVFDYIPRNIQEEIVRYINNPMTATWFNDKKKGAAKGADEVITSEIIYWWMIDLRMPIELEHWHLNQLLTLIKVINEKHQPPKKRSFSEIAAERKALNEKRRAEALARRQSQQ